MIMSARGWRWAHAAGLLGAAVLLLMARGVLVHPVHYDELLHILSARGLLQTGVPAIADGLYVRASGYTYLVALSFDWFGESPVSARLPALAAGAVLVYVVAAWVTRRIGFFAGTAAALLLCAVPTTVDVAVFARFYTVHALVMLLMFIAGYEALQPGRATAERVVGLVALVLLVLLGWHFQDTTVIAVGAVTAGMLAVLAMDHWTQVAGFIRRRPVLTVAAVAALAGTGVAATAYLGMLEQLSGTALWAAGNARRYQYYLMEFRDDLPLLWPLLPAAGVVALQWPTGRRLALFCLVAVVSALLVHSVAAQKTMRYVYYLVPLICIVWAAALANLVAAACQRERARSVAHAQRSSPLLWAVLLATVLLSQEGARGLKLLAGEAADVERRPFADEPNWAPLVAELAPRSRDADRVVTSNSMKALYFLGRYDYELNSTIVPETETGTEFGRDERTGRQAIGAPESVRQVLERPGTTLVVIESSKIGRTSGVTSGAYSVIESHCGEVALPHGSGVRAWWCAAPAGPRRD